MTTASMVGRPGTKEAHWIDGAARVGFVARGIVYLIIGVLAAKIAFGDPQGETADKEGALAVVADQPFGRSLLVVMAIGLAGYALWRFTEAAWGKRDETDEKKRGAKRAASAGKGVLYAAFCATAISFLLADRDGGAQPNGGSVQEQTWTARMLGWPGGRGIVAMFGVTVVAGGLYLAYRGLTQKFEKRLETGRMSAGTRRATEVIGTVGSAARGVVFALAGLLLVKAAIDFSPSEAQGIDGTLRTVAARSHGQILLLLAAIGLGVFGAYSFIEARYRRLHT